MKNKTFGLSAIAGAMLVAVVLPSAYAANPLPVKSVAVQSATVDRGSARVIVRYRDGVADRSLKLAAVDGAAARASLVLPAANGTASARPLSASHRRTLATGADLIELSRKLNSAEMARLLTEISADPAVKYAEADVLDQPSATPDDPLYAQYQWHLSDPVGGINAPAAWDIAQGEGVVVAVLDTGILPDHPDSNVNLLEGYDFITDTFVSRRATIDRVAGALDYGDWNDDASECSVGSSSWHGTHVAGTIAEATNNGIGMAGVAYKSSVLPVRVLGRCGGWRSDIVDAIVWASGGSVPDVPANANPAEIINMSLGGGGACAASYQDAINSAVSRGTTVVVAAGNSASNAANFSPASCANVISVGASRSTGGITSYSNYGALVDIAAPGGGGGVDGNPRGYVWQAAYDGTTTPTSGAYIYRGMGGTSMASPHVAGVAALVQGALAAASRDLLTPAELEALLKKSARAFPVSIPANTPIGSGIVNAWAALEEALKEPCTENCAPEATPLANRVPVRGLAGQGGKDTLYSFQARAGAVLSVLAYGGTGNVSLYVSFDKEPTPANFDAKSTRPGNSETVRFTAPHVGTYYIKLLGESAYSGVTLEVRQ